MSLALPWLPADTLAPFPPAQHALREPDGLLCAGGDLSPERLLLAYRHGIFPWFSPGEPILWWSPDPRTVFDTASFRLPSRFRRQLRRSTWQVRANSAFAEVIGHCASIPRPGQAGTWIGPAVQAAYQRLHHLGHAHSVEVFEEDTLVGGLYGVMIGRMFFAESMFSRKSGGSKVALAALARFLHAQDCPLIDAQVDNPHLRSLGAVQCAREAFLQQVASLCQRPPLALPFARLWQPLAAQALAA